MLKKLCSYHGCKSLADYGVQYCDKHKTIADKKYKDRYKTYKDNKIRYDEHEKDIQDFYKSIQWTKVRELVQVKQYGIDIFRY